MAAALFSYTADDISRALTRSTVESFRLQSKLDELLLQRWELAMSSGVFRYDLSGVVTRRVPGEFGFIVQCNSKRYTHRRLPAKMGNLRQPFDPTHFNFNHVKPAEVLFQVCRNDLTGNEVICSADGREERDGEGEGREERDEEGGREEVGAEGGGKEGESKHHLVVVNVSPITHGHCLLIPEPKSCLPQVMTEDSLRLCLEMVAISNDSGFTIVANSLLAYASVNHLHYHILYVSEPVLAARVEGRGIAGHVYELTNHPSVGLGFQVSASTQDCARDIFSVVNILLERDIPHNLVMLKGTPFDHDAPAAQVVKAILIPRKPHYGAKTWSSTPPPLCAAACELAQGFIPVLDESRYHTLTENEILEILQGTSISKENFQSLVEDIKTSLNTNGI